MATRQRELGNRKKIPSTSATFSLNLAIAGLSTTATTATIATKSTEKNIAKVTDQSQVSRGKAPTLSPTSLFFMRSHAQPIVLACHRARWLVRSWASIGPAATWVLSGDGGVNTGEWTAAAIAEKANAAEGAVRLLSLAVDHLSYLNTARPFLAGCVAYWLWEHGRVRAHVRDLLTGGSGRGGVPT